MERLAAVGVQWSAWIWRYSPHIARPTASFPEHRALAGRRLDEIPTVDGLFPGDHQGCVICTAVPVLRGPGGRFVSPDVLS